MGPDGPSLSTIIARHKRETAVVVALGADRDDGGDRLAKFAGECAQRRIDVLDLGLRRPVAAGRIRPPVPDGVRRARSDASVVSAINSACTHAAYLGEADDVSILAAINHAF